MNTSYEDFKEKVKNSVDIVEVISEYVDLKKVGKNYKGLCPFHQEKTPSFTINPEKQFYHCFGCGVGGDVYEFMMEIENITFKESLNLLSERAGLQPPSRTNKQKEYYNKRDKLFNINNLSARFYHYLLLNKDVGKKALSYLNKRGFTEKDIKKFELGYAPDRWKSLLNFLVKKGYQKEELVKAGLIRKKNSNYYDRFRGRIIFPIFNIRDEVLAFGARLLDEENTDMPKYLNSPGTLIYNKGNNLYGINWAKSSIRKTGEAIIMEGYTDVLTAHKAGINNTVASLGTALTRSQAKVLNRLADIVYIAYDADTAGAAATLRGLDILKKSGLKVKVINLPEGEDPDDFIRNNSKKDFLNLQNKALSLIDFKINQIIGDKDGDNLEVEDKVNLSHNIIKVLSSIEDPIEQDVYIQRIAEKMKLDKELIKNELKKVKKKDKNNKKRYNKNINNTKSLSSIIKLERKIIKFYIDFPEYRKDIIKRIKPQFFSNNYKKVAKWLWSNYSQSISTDVKKLEDEKIKSIIMSLLVSEENMVNFSTVENWIDKVKGNVIFKNKLKLYKKLQEPDKITLASLNKLLYSYKDISDLGRR
ncbi:MAG: DNA primase [Halanaerobiales bacterium]